MIVHLRQIGLLALALLIIQGCSDEPQVNPNRFPFERPPVPEPIPRVHVSLSGAAVPATGTPAAIVPSPSVVYAGEPFVASMTVGLAQRQDDKKIRLLVKITRRGPNGNEIICGGGFLKAEQVTGDSVLFEGKINAPKRVGEYTVDVSDITQDKGSLGSFTISTVAP